MREETQEEQEVQGVGNIITNQAREKEMSKVIDSAALYFREGSSDKVYNCSLEQSGDGYVVNFSYGRRGAALTTGTKTTSPVSMEKARQAFDKLVKEKTGKGYKALPGAGSEGIPTVAPAKTPTSARCVLLNSVESDRAEELLGDFDWLMQEKVDGVRFMVEKKGGVVRGFNRLGAVVSVPKPLSDELSGATALSLDKDFLLDGELVGDVLHVFDVLAIGGSSIEDKPFVERSMHLGLIGGISWKNLRVVPVIVGDNKSKVFKQVSGSGGEGVVFKRATAPYRVGRPASGGDYLKFKFTADCTCLVAEVNDKRSVRLSLFEKPKFLGLKKGGKLVDAGNVTIPPNHEIPEVGATVDVRYLYAFKESGKLFQPVYLGVRTDIKPKDCTVEQLKYKPGSEIDLARAKEEVGEWKGRDGLDRMLKFLDCGDDS